MFEFKAKYPEAVLYEPSVFAVSAPYPTAVLASPVVTASKAVVPTATLSNALLVVDEGSFPIYIELSSIIASASPSIEFPEEAFTYVAISDTRACFITSPSDITKPSVPTNVTVA